MIYAGIDGCKSGWVLMLHSDKGLYFGGVFRTLTELYLEIPIIDRTFIDMPMGLSSAGHLRTLESLIRRELKGRSSTVFNAPTREAIYAATYEEASQINERIEGKKLSKQTYNIMEKIRELDLFLSRHDSIDHCIESHPELCFKHLNEGQVVLSRKTTKQGQEERLSILVRHEPNVRTIYENALRSTLRKHVKADDLIDALCLCISNRLCGPDQVPNITDPLEKDARGIPMRIGYGVSVIN